jgi:hypothetical protein
MWIENYSTLENPGPDFVRSQLQRVGHHGEVVLISGDSPTTVPAFLQGQPDLFFDLITVDADHTEAGARLDLENVLHRLKVGGVLVFDDIAHPQFPWLERTWDEVVASNTNFVCAKYTEVGHGVAFAIRRDLDAGVDVIKGLGAARLAQVSRQLKEARVEERQLRAMLAIKEQYEESLREALATKDTDVVSRLDTLTTKDSYLLALQESLATLETYTISLRTALAAREAEPADATEQIALFQQMLAAREAEIASAKEQIDLLREALETEAARSADHIAALQATLAAREAEVASAKTHIAALQAALAAREAELTNAKTYLDSLEQHLEQVQTYASVLQAIQHDGDRTGC